MTALENGGGGGNSSIGELENHERRIIATESNIEGIRFSSMIMCADLLHQYIKKYKVGHGARKCDHFARAVFVSIVGAGDQQLTLRG